MAYEPNPDEMDDPDKLRTLIENARRLGRDDLVLRCQAQIARLAGNEYDDELEQEFWQAVHMAGEISLANTGKKTPLTKTRQKFRRDGAQKCIADFATRSDFTDGYRLLTDAGYQELTFEAVLLRHPDQFTPEDVKKVRKKLEKAEPAKAEPGEAASE